VNTLEWFGLPPTFPPEAVPAVFRRSRTADVDVYRFGLTVDGCVVPLMARMRRIDPPVSPSRPPERDERQGALF
jgi:hypothetical protein